MRLARQQAKEILEAMLSAYGNKSSLGIMVRLQLDEDLDKIAGGENLRVLVFNLIRWAEATDSVAKLIEAACRENPQNLGLQEQLEKLQQQAPPAKPPTPGHTSPASKEDPARQETPSSLPTLSWENDILRNGGMNVFLKGVKELFVSGGHLNNFLNAEKYPIRLWLTRNSRARLKLILESPEAARSNHTPVGFGSREDYIRLILDSLDHQLTELMTQFNTPANPDRIEVRLTAEVPSLTVMICDHHKARVNLNLYLGRPMDRPVIEMSKARHKEWFDLFYDRYRRRLWAESSPWVPGQNIP